MRKGPNKSYINKYNAEICISKCIKKELVKHKRKTNNLELSNKVVHF